MHEYLTKGRPVLNEGRLRLRTWDTGDGQTRRKHDVFVERFTFVQGRQDEANSAATQGGAKEHSEDDIPF